MKLFNTGNLWHMCQLNLYHMYLNDIRIYDAGYA